MRNLIINKLASLSALANLLAVILLASCSTEDVELNPQNGLIKVVTMQGSESYTFCKETNDGNYLVGGSVNFDAFVSKVDTAGRVLWYSTAGNNDEDFFFDAAETNSGNILGVGYSRKQEELNSYKPFIGQFNAQGVLLSQNNDIIEGPLGQSSFERVLPISENRNIVISGIREYEARNGKRSLMLINNKGDLIKENRQYYFRSILYYDADHVIAQALVLNGSVFTHVLCILDFELNITRTVFLDDIATSGNNIATKLKRFDNGFVILNYNSVANGNNTTEIAILDNDLVFRGSVILDDNYNKVEVLNSKSIFLFQKSYSVNVITETNMQMAIVDVETFESKTFSMRSDIQAQDILFLNPSANSIDLVVSFKNYNSNGRSLGFLKMNYEGDILAKRD